MIEYCLGWIFFIQNKIALAGALQQQQHWAPEPFLDRPQLFQKRVAILGSGDIGKSIARALHPLGCKVVGFSRRGGGTPLPEFSLISSNIHEVLRGSDVIINCLPSTSLTRGMLTAETFAACKDKAPIFINVGRGDITKTSTVLSALNDGHLAHAVLDVFEQEPLPRDDPLWLHPRAHLSPHISAVSTPGIVAKVFVDNLEKFTHGEPVDYVVDFQNEY